MRDSRQHDDEEQRRSSSSIQRIGNLLRRTLQQIRTIQRPLSSATRIFVGSFAIYMTSAAFRNLPAQASAPVMALPKAEGRDPASEALMEHDRRMIKQAQLELDEMAQKAREIEKTKGEGARVKFEREFKENQKKRAEEKKKGLEELKRNLLDQGIDPFTDIEGKRQVTFFEKGVDLGDVPGTPFNLEKEFERTNFKRSQAFQKQYHRQIIACIVKDMKNKGEDPLEYFEARQDKTEKILDLPIAQAKALAEQYATNLEQYGQITVPKPGEQSTLEKMKLRENSPDAKKAARAAAKAEAKRLKEEKRAQRKEEKELLKAQKKEAKEQKKAEKQAKKEGAKKAKAVAAATAAAATTAATNVAKEGTAAAQAVMDQLPSASVEQSEGLGLTDPSGQSATSPNVPAPPVKKGSAKKASKTSGIPIVPAAAFAVAAGGGSFAFKIYQEKAAKAEEERQRQFKLLMGMDDDEDSSRDDPFSESAPPLKEVDVDVSTAIKPQTPPAPTPAPVAAPAPKKKKRGLGVFNRKKNDRETDLNNLVSADANAPEFASLLAKILTFGAPGRFPTVVSLPGGMPMESFDLEAAREMLTAAREEAGLSLEESAEVFANVVNCMLIDIVDLGAAALKEDDKTTASAIDIVVDFMQHAASLYDSVAESVVISPVTYGGDLSKSKLEKMYGTYSGGAMGGLDNIKDDFDDRLRLLQDVFQISDKKAEGIMMKVMQKNMMEMLKSGEGLEGLGEMMGGMGGMPGMGDLAGGIPGLDGEEPSPEQVKEMLLALKEMKDSGSFSPEELASIKKEFKSSFGSSIDDIANSQPLDGTEQELLDLMKYILED